MVLVVVRGPGPCHGLALQSPLFSTSCARRRHLQICRTDIIGDLHREQRHSAKVSFKTILPPSCTTTSRSRAWKRFWSSMIDSARRRMNAPQRDGQLSRNLSAADDVVKAPSFLKADRRSRRGYRHHIASLALAAVISLPLECLPLDTTTTTKTTTHRPNVLAMAPTRRPKVHSKGMTVPLKVLTGTGVLLLSAGAGTVIGESIPEDDDKLLCLGKVYQTDKRRGIGGSCGALSKLYFQRKTVGHSKSCRSPE